MASTSEPQLECAVNTITQRRQMATRTAGLKLNRRIARHHTHKNRPTTTYLEETSADQSARTDDTHTSRYATARRAGVADA